MSSISALPLAHLLASPTARIIELSMLSSKRVSFAQYLRWLDVDEAGSPFGISVIGIQLPPDSL
jgi:hypothetical protein